MTSICKNIFKRAGNSHAQPKKLLQKNKKQRTLLSIAYAEAKYLWQIKSYV